MDEVFIALLSAVGELLLEMFFQVVVEAIVALVVRSVRNVLRDYFRFVRDSGIFDGRQPLPWDYFRVARHPLEDSCFAC
jgi:hypothetical protein